MTGIRRRDFLASGALAAGALAISPAFLRDALAAPAQAGPSPYGPLQPPDANGLMLPPGFSSREVARGLQPVPGTAYPWPVFSDGQATYPSRTGGWILVTNSESLAASGAGSSAIRFRPDGSIESAYRILGGTHLNCAGGPTPWGTWLSCEEHDGGLVWECDPAGVLTARPRPALGAFNHEAAAVEPAGRRLYLTEDESDGGFYRFTPARYPNLDSGLLEVASVGAAGRVTWTPVPDPAGISKPTRDQVPGMTPFNGGEGIWHAAGVLYFSTKGDKKVWAYTAATSTIEVLFDRTTAADSSLDAVDNVTVNGAGEVFVCEDGGNMEIGLITPERTVSPFLRFTGDEHPTTSEVCGVCFNPAGTRMYCTSQRSYPPAEGTPTIPGPIPVGSGPGVVVEISGPFNGGPFSNSGIPAGELRPRGPLNPGRPAPRMRVRLRAARRVRRAALLRRGLLVSVEVDRAALVSVSLSSSDLVLVPGRGLSSARPRRIRLGRARKRLRRRGRVRLRLRVGAAARRRLQQKGGPVNARVLVVARDRAGNRRVVTQRVRIGPRRGRSPSFAGRSS